MQTEANTEQHHATGGQDLRPIATRCNECFTVAAETVCHVCKTPRPHYLALQSMQLQR